WTYCALRPEGRARSCKRSEALGCALEGSPDSYCAESKECAGSSAERLPKTTTAPSNEGCFVSSDQPRRLGQAASTVRATVEALNTTIGRPVSAIDICEALTNKERQTLAPRRSALRKRVARVLDELARRHILGKVKDGRTPVFFVPGILPEEACKQAAKPSRRRRVLSLVYTTVIELQRAVRVADVVEVADASGVTEEIPAHMIKRDLANLVRTGELRIIDTVRGDGGGSNLYLPSDLDPAAYAVDDPLTWLEELHTAFQFEWAERVLAAELSDQRVVPPS